VRWRQGPGSNRALLLVQCVSYGGVLVPRSGVGSAHTSLLRHLCLWLVWMVLCGWEWCRGLLLLCGLQWCRGLLLLCGWEWCGLEWCRGLLLLYGLEWCRGLLLLRWRFHRYVLDLLRNRVASCTLWESWGHSTKLLTGLLRFWRVFGAAQIPSLWEGLRSTIQDGVGLAGWSWLHRLV